MHAFYEPPFSWIAVFLAVSYLMGVACVYHALRVVGEEGWSSGLREIAIFLAFCGLGYFVESWAHARTPYYVYATEFPDRLPRLPVENWSGLFRVPRTTDCATFCKDEHNKLIGRTIPLSVPILEGSMAYGALWTARLLVAPVWLRPLLAGLVLVTIDALIDPIVASTYTCKGIVVRKGLGFWRWYIDKEQLAAWYGIPLFNFAGWYGAAMFLVALAHLIGWGDDTRRWLVPKLRRRPPPADRPPMWRGVLLIMAVVAPVVVVRFSPSIENALPPSVQWAALAAIVGGTVFLVMRQARIFRTDGRVRPELIQAVFLPVAFGIVALIVSGQFIGTPTFLIPALILVGAGAVIAWWPYEPGIRWFADRLADVDRFIRLHYVGYPWMLVMLGAAFSARHGTRLSAPQIGGMLLVALSFHIYSCVMNDVIDLRLDQSQVRRNRDLLVSGRIEPGTALRFALVQLPIMAFLTQLLRGELLPVALLTVACALMAVYNVWGKRFPVPPVTDALQGIAWGTLALYGAAVVGSISPAAWIVCAYGAGFILLINGIHGGLRDLANDVGNGRNNTAHWLGAMPDRSDQYTVRSTTLVVVFAFAVQTLLFALVGYQLYQKWLSYDAAQRAAVITALGLVAVVCHVLLWRLVKPGPARRDDAGSMHAFAILLPLLIVFWPALNRPMRVIVPLCYFVPLLVQFVEPVVVWFVPKLKGEMLTADGNA